MPQSDGESSEGGSAELASGAPARGGPAPLSRARRVAYALGMPGFSITDRIVVTMGIFYYLPPDGVGLVPQLADGWVLGGLTAYGAARLLGGMIDSLADPLVGYGSDRSRSRWGRRRVYMIAGVLPMVGAAAAIFWPWGGPGSRLSFAGLAVMLAIYYVAFTAYVGPYLALLPELARSERDRVSLSSLLALTGFPVVALFVPAWLWALDRLRDGGLGAEAALRQVVVGSSVVALVLCLAPILAVDERRFARGVAPSLGMREAVAATLRNRPFLIYLAAQIFFILGINLIAPAAPYLAVVLLGRDEGFAALLGLLTLTALPALPLIWLATHRWGPKRTILGCVLALAGLMAALAGIVPDAPGGVHDARNVRIAVLVMALAGVPVAGFLVLPPVMMGQLIDLDESRTGAARSAMYFGVQGLLTKWVYAAAAALLSFLFAAYGNTRAEPLGVWLIGPVAAGLCLVSAALYALYPEAEVRRRAARGARGAGATTGDPPG